MTLRKKTQITLIITMLVILLLMDFIFTGLLRTSAEHTDQERLVAALSKASSSVTAEARTLSDLADNWAFSDDTYEYLLHPNNHYIKKTFNKKIITDLGISSVILMNSNRQVMLFKDFSLSTAPSVPQHEYQAIFSDKNDFNTLLNKKKNKHGISGVTLLNKHPILFTVKPVFPSSREGGRVGYLIATKVMDNQLLNTISESNKFQFTIKTITQDDLNKKNLPVLAIEDENKETSYVSGKILIKNRKGTPVFWIYGKSHKKDLHTTEREIQKFFLLLACLGLAIVILLDYVMNKLLYKRVKRLRKEIEVIRDNHVNGAVTVDKSHDEITWLQQTFNDLIAYREFLRDKTENEYRKEIEHWKKDAEKYKNDLNSTLVTMATTFSPGDGYFRTSLIRAAEMTEKFALYIGMEKEEARRAYYGALFSRIGQVTLPHSMQAKNAEYSNREKWIFRKYPLTSKDIVKSMSAIDDSYEIPLEWNENWDGSGFPRSTSGQSIPLVARIYAICDLWNELTRSWPGRKMLTDEEVWNKLRELKGTRLDPTLTEEFITMMKIENKGPKS